MSTKVGDLYGTLALDTSKWQSGVKAAQNSAKQLQQSTKAVGDTAKAAQKAANDAGKGISNGLGAADGAARRSGDSARVMSDRWSGARESMARGWSVVSGAVATAAAVSIGAVTTFAVKAVMTGVAYNQLESSSRKAFTTILGSDDAANAMMDELMAFAKQSPFPREAFIQATQQLLGFGLSAEKVIPTLTAIQNSVAATGGSAQDIGEISSVLADVIGTGKVTAETLNMLGIRGVDAATIVGQRMGKTGEEIRDGISKGTIAAGTFVDELVAGMNDKFGGAAAGLKETWLGATDRVKGAFRDMSSAIIEPFISKNGGGYAVEWANKLADLMRRMIATVIPRITEKLKEWAPILDDLVNKAIALIDKLTGTSGEWFTQNNLSGLLDTVKQFAPLLAGLGSAGMGNIPMIGQFLPSINPVLAGIAAIVLASPEGRDALMQIFNAVQPLIPIIADLAAQILTALSPAIISLFEALTPVITALADMLTGFLATDEGQKIFLITLEAIAAIYVGNKLANGIDAATQAWKAGTGAIGAVSSAMSFLAANPIVLVIAIIVALVAAIWWLYQNNEDFRRGVQIVWEAIQNAIKFAWENVILPIWEAIKFYIMNILIPYYMMLWNVVQVAWDIIQNVISFAWNSVIKPVWDAIVGFIEEYLVPMWNTLAMNVAAANNIIMGVITMVWEYISGLISFVWENIIMPVFNAIKWYIETVMVPIWMFLWSVIQTVWNAIAGAIGWARDLIFGIFDTIIDKISGFIGFLWGIVTTVFEIGYNIASAIMDGFKSVWNSIADAINGVIPDQVDLPLGFGFDLPDNPIPRFHTGGVFNPGGGQREGLALLERGERVVDGGTGGTGSGGGGMTIILQGRARPEDGQEVVSAIAQYERSSGKTWRQAPGRGRAPKPGWAR